MKVADVINESWFVIKPFGWLAFLKSQKLIKKSFWVDKIWCYLLELTSSDDRLELPIGIFYY